MKNILLVEDNVKIQEINKELLEEVGGYEVSLAMNLAEARASIKKRLPNLIVLDIMLPDGSGLDFLKELRSNDVKTPVLLLTALSETSDEIRAIREGGDDYIAKPYDNGVLLVRIEALLRRTSFVPKSLSKGKLKLDFVSGSAYLDGEDMMLSKKEFSLLRLFIQNESCLMSAENLYEAVWGQPMGSDSQALSAALSRLRKKLTGCGYTISTEYGVGYRFERG